jgi:hypothetical protein
VSFAAITLCVASQRVFVVVYFVIDSVRKLLDTHPYTLFRADILNIKILSTENVGYWGEHSYYSMHFFHMHLSEKPHQVLKYTK